MTSESIAHHLRARKSGNGWMAKCPAHDDNNPSLSIREVDGKILVHCHAGCPQSAVLNALKGSGVWESMPSKNDNRIVATYDYTDEQGEVLYQAVRLRDPKEFFQRRPNGRGGWINNLGNTRRVLYHLPEVAEAPIVFVVEGEKDCESLRERGFCATCNPLGAGKWRPEYAEMLRGKECVILPDNDEPGRLHAQTVARSLIGMAVKIIVLTFDEPEIKDISDWFGAGHSETELIAHVEGQVVTQ